MRKNSIKNTRINGEVQRELSRIISREIKDPRIAPMTSVVDAVVTSDLKQCKAYISVLGDSEAQKATLEGLKSAEGYIRREQREIDEMRRLENRLLPPDAPYAAIHGLRKEAQEKLARVRPRSIGQASRISGVSPADVSVLIVWSAAQTRGGSGECK